MRKFKLTIRTPMDTIYEDLADSIVVKTEVGIAQVLSNHADFGGIISSSECKVNSDNEEVHYQLARGFITFDNHTNSCNILCQRAVKLEEFDYDGVEEYLRLIQERLQNEEDLSDFQLKYLENERLAVSKK